jgi:hypothetical protein
MTSALTKYPFSYGYKPTLAPLPIGDFETENRGKSMVPSLEGQWGGLYCE